MKIYKVIISSTAKSNLASIYDYISQDSVNNAEKFTNHLENEINALEIFPNAFPEFNSSKFSIFNLRTKIVDKNYLIVYEVDEFFLEVIVHAIVHVAGNAE